MPIIHAVVLGIVQGLAEFLPISSSGHLIVVPWLFGWTELTGKANADLNKTFDVALHVGTFLAAIVYFWRDLARLAAAGAVRAGPSPLPRPEPAPVVGSASSGQAFAAVEVEVERCIARNGRVCLAGRSIPARRFSPAGTSGTGSSRPP